MLISVFIPLQHILNLRHHFPDAAVLHFPYESGSCSEVQGASAECAAEERKKLPSPGSQDVVG